jgi:hypothetical protein
MVVGVSVGVLGRCEIQILQITDGKKVIFPNGWKKINNGWKKMGAFNNSNICP